MQRLEPQEMKGVRGGYPYTINSYYCDDGNDETMDAVILYSDGTWGCLHKPKPN